MLIKRDFLAYSKRKQCKTILAVIYISKMAATCWINTVLKIGLNL